MKSKQAARECVAIALALLCLPLAAEEGAWTYQGEIYALAADVEIATPDGLSSTAEFDDILDNLEFALFGSLAAKRDKFAFMANVLYVDLDASETRTRGPLTTRLEAELETFVATLVAGWEIYGASNGVMHGVAGARVLVLDTKLTVEIDPLGEAGNEDSTDVWDAVVGIQGRTDFSERWYLNYYLDMGAGKSDFTWQSSAAVGYRFSHVDVALGYQYIEWEFDDLALEDLTISGPALGLRFHW